MNEQFKPTKNAKQPESATTNEPENTPSNITVKEYLDSKKHSPSLYDHLVKTKLTTSAPCRRILVTGSSRGIGKAIALALAQDGFDVTVHAKSRMNEAHQVVQQIQNLGQRSHALQFDVNDRKAVHDIITDDIDTHGAYYGVVLNAGISRDGAFPALTDDDWDSVINTSLNGFYNVLKPAVMPMVRAKKGGRIVTIASVSGLMGNRGQVNYSGAKSGLMGSTKALALELATRDITVNCVAPGLIETDMVSDDVIERALPLIPMRRTGTCQDVANLVSFICSDKAGYITRQVLSVNGGMV